MLVVSVAALYLLYGHVERTCTAKGGHTVQSIQTRGPVCIGPDGQIK